MPFSGSTQWPVCDCSESGQLGYPGLDFAVSLGGRLRGLLIVSKSDKVDD